MCFFVKFNDSSVESKSVHMCCLSMSGYFNHIAKCVKQETSCSHHLMPVNVGMKISEYFSQIVLCEQIERRGLPSVVIEKDWRRAERILNV